VHLFYAVAYFQIHETHGLGLGLAVGVRKYFPSNKLILKSCKKDWISELLLVRDESRLLRLGVEILDESMRE